MPVWDRAILVHVAKIGYARPPAFEQFAAEQYPMEKRIAYAMRHKNVLREAQRAEGLDPDKIPEDMWRVSEKEARTRRAGVRAKSRL